MHRPPSFVRRPWMALVLVSALFPAAARAEITLSPPDDGLILDAAGLLNAPQAEQVAELADRLLVETAVPLVVVTIERKADYVHRKPPVPPPDIRHRVTPQPRADSGDGGMTIEAFARALYDQWGIGHMSLDGVDFNRGILLLVARSDREARIELGGGYGRRMDADAQWIMDNRILPRFRAEDYGGGIVVGAEALAEMARGELKTSGLLAVRRPWWVYAIGVGLLAVAVFSAISLHRQGRHGWAFAMWAVILGTLWWILRNAARTSGRSGGFRGGGFGGGFSGGGGASGRW